ncbi:hypothetical protein [Nonlabens tegetincola]|uniref:hypothetical protein n=1 Tax=Nonlabens tegetincola TaxID=323273 RepID=UPI000CF48A3A|nr:hypothetical protein [Nonlabens tegetincola]PQJ17049.1 hypothetical protein BST93_10275 [Nonlabens tegetincola]
MKLKQKHLAIFNIYQGKKSTLLKIGTAEEKKLFQNGEFEKITQLINKEHAIKQNLLSHHEIEAHKIELNLIFDRRWDKKSLRYLSKKYCEPDKEVSTFESVMMFLWAVFS